MRNEYDNESIFAEYAKMPRSREGLSAAGEWHQLKPLFPELRGKSVLDLGCGYGWHCQFAAQQGAAAVLGIDASRKMIEEAERRNAGHGIQYQVCGIDAYAYPENTWDCVMVGYQQPGAGIPEGVPDIKAGRRIPLQYRTPGFYRRRRAGLGLYGGWKAPILAH